MKFGRLFIPLNIFLKIIEILMNLIVIMSVFRINGNEIYGREREINPNFENALKTLIQNHNF